MKKIVYLIILLLAMQASMAQAPMSFNYQGVARNAQGQALANQTIKVRASLIKNIDGGISIVTFYTETRTVTTNQLGLFGFKIGDDAATFTGFISNGDWNNGNTTQHLKIELDVNNSGTWTDMGTQQIVSVPYAMFAGEAAKAKGLSIPLTAFSAASTTSQTVLNNSENTVSFETIETSSSNFDLGTDQFTATTTGWHHFDVSVSSTYNASNGGALLLYINVNNARRRQFMTDAVSTQVTVGGGVNLYLNSGDKVSITVSNNGTGMSATVGGQYTYFSGHVIR